MAPTPLWLVANPFASSRPRPGLGKGPSDLERHLLPQHVVAGSRELMGDGLERHQWMCARGLPLVEAPNDVREFTTTGPHLPLVSAMTCLNGFFHDVYSEQSLAEALQTAPNGGAIAIWASSTVTKPDMQAVMNRGLVRRLLQGMTLGEAAVQAKAAVPDPDVRRTWILFGDPTTRLK